MAEKVGMPQKMWPDVSASDLGFLGASEMFEKPTSKSIENSKESIAVDRLAEVQC